MTARTAYTCDSCGRMAEVPAPLPAWLTVKAVLLGGITLPRVPDDRHPDPDLCSWECVAAYATRQAEIRASEEAAANAEPLLGEGLPGEWRFTP